MLPLIIAIAACTSSRPAPPDDQPKHPLLDSLEPPSLNRPIKAAPAKADQTKPTLPDDDRQALLVLRGDRAFSGRFEGTGDVIVDKNRIEFRPKTGDTFVLMYRLPEGMPALPETTGVGFLRIAEFGGPEGADRIVVVNHKEDLLLGELWRRSPEPLSLEVGRGLRLSQQRAPAPPKGSNYSEAPIGIYRGRTLVARLPIGKATPVDTSMGLIEAFVEVSHRFTPGEADLDQHPAEYILHAWLSKSEGR
jgi:hypothetical protein